MLTGRQGTVSASVQGVRRQVSQDVARGRRGGHLSSRPEDQRRMGPRGRCRLQHLAQLPVTWHIQRVEVLLQVPAGERAQGAALLLHSPATANGACAAEQGARPE